MPAYVHYDEVGGVFKSWLSGVLTDIGAPVPPGGFTTGSVIFAGASGELAEDNTRLFWDNTNNRLGVCYNIPQMPLHVRAPGIDVGYVARFEDDGSAGSSYIQILSPSGGNAQAGFALQQSTHGVEWRVAVIGNVGPDSVIFYDGSQIAVSITTPKRNLIIDSAASDPGTGTKCLIFGDGTAPSSMASNTAGLYANDVSGTVNIFSINEAGDVNQISGDFVVASGKHFYTRAADFMIRGLTTWNNGAGAGAGTLTNAPTAGDPTKWIPIDDNGTTRYIPTWT